MNRRSSSRIVAIAAFGLLCAAFGTAETDQKPEGEVAYPVGYRNWMHIKSGILANSNTRYDGIHYIYANEKAVAGYKSGSFADGSVIVFDMWRVKEAAAEKIAKTASTIDPVERKFIDVMVRDSARFAKSGGWGFEEFAGDSQTERLIKNSERQCAACHRNGAGPDGVFSDLLG